MIEIERKFLVNAHQLTDVELQNKATIKQGYLSYDPEIRVGLSLKDNGRRYAYLTVKGYGQIERLEVEKEISPEEAEELFPLCHHFVHKIRYKHNFGGKLWEIDAFQAANQGLWVAEVELIRADEQIDIPMWAGLEVTNDPRYRNSNLARNKIKE